MPDCVVLMPSWIELGSNPTLIALLFFCEAVASPPLINGGVGFLSGNCSTPKKTMSPFTQMSTLPARTPTQLGSAVTYGTGALATIGGTAGLAVRKALASAS